jgi:hypothetical protein
MPYIRDPFHSARLQAQHAARIERRARLYLLTLAGFALGGAIVWVWA